MEKEQIQKFIENYTANVDYIEYINKENGMFALTYYDTFKFFSLTGKKIKYLNEDIMQQVKPHKKKLVFIFKMTRNYTSFELKTLVFGAPLQKCIRVVNAIKSIFNEFEIGTHIRNITGQDTKTYTFIEIIKTM